VGHVPVHVPWHAQQVSPEHSHREAGQTIHLETSDALELRQVALCGLGRAAVLVDTAQENLDAASKGRRHRETPR